VTVRAAAAGSAGINPDPAFDYKGLMWDYGRMGLPKGWRTTAGSPKVTVAVSDTGLDYTHSELAPKVERVIDFIQFEDPPFCKTEFGISDEELAAEFGGPADGDWYGHGSWIGGNVAAALDRQGVNGIASKVGLVSLKIAQWCGFAYESSIIASFVTAADLGIDVVNISFGGYLDRSDPEQELIYRAFVDAVRYARSKGTVIVAAAGNASARIGAGGLVLSHGTLTTPGDELFDAFGLYEVPGGIPGVVNVSSTGNVVNRPPRPARRALSAIPALRPASTPPASRRATRTRRPVPAGRTSSPTTRTTGRRSTWRARGGAQVQPAQLRPGWHARLPVHQRGPDQRLAGLQHRLQLRHAGPLLRVQQRLRVPAGRVLHGHPGHLDGRPARGRRLRPVGECPPRAAQASGRADRLGQGPRQRQRPQPHPGAVGHRPSGGDLTGGTCPTGYCHLEGPRISDRDAYGVGLVNSASPKHDRVRGAGPRAGPSAFHHSRSRGPGPARPWPAGCPARA
jgi:hypothetical protein